MQQNNDGKSSIEPMGVGGWVGGLFNLVERRLFYHSFLVTIFHVDQLSINICTLTKWSECVIDYVIS